jgi:hypothetical protein
MLQRPVGIMQATIASSFRSVPYLHHIRHGVRYPAKPGLAAWKKQGELKSQLPISRFIWMHDIVVAGDLRIERLSTNPEDTAYAAADWHRPLLAGAGVPVHRNDWRGSQIPATGKIVVDKGLNQAGIHGRPIRGASE